jgi:hypothetical protein
VGAAFAHVRQQKLMTPDDAEAVNRALAEGDGDFALRMILQARDDLRADGIDPDVAPSVGPSGPFDRG